MKTALEAKDRYLAEFGRSGKGPLKAIDRFAALGFPTGREEEWRFTDISPLLDIPFRPAAGTANPAPLAPLARGPLKDCQLAFVDGRFSPAFSSGLPAGVTVEGPGEPDPEGTAFTALNAAFSTDGARIRIPPGAVLEKPIHLLFLSSLHGEPYMTHPRILVTAGEGANATIVESFLGPPGGVYFTNAVTQVVAADGAVLDYTKVQRESRDAFHVASLRARLGRDASFTHHSISLGGRLARNDFTVVLDGEGASCGLFGLFEVAGAQLADHHTMIDHARPNGTSRELYKGILGGRARGVFDGRIVVRPEAQKTNALQSSRNLLLSAEARVHTRPRLEIFADDVKCKHGATVGQLDLDVLFYLRSRGIGLEEARRLLVHAFAGEILDQVRSDAVRTQVGGCMGIMR